METVTDIHHALVDRCLRGDRKAQYELYRLYSRAMFNVAMRITKDHMDAEDALQEAFVRAFRNLSSFKRESTFGAWLKRIVINTAINLLNKKKDIWADIDQHAVEMPEENLPDESPAWDMETIRQKILQLPEGYRMVFNLYLIEGYDHIEISSILNISEATSKSQYHRAKKKLRELLEEESQELRGK